MSALPTKADRCSAKRNAGYGAKADIAKLSHNLRSSPQKTDIVLVGFSFRRFGEGISDPDAIAASIDVCHFRVEAVMLI
jgi:hypothetical protein